MVAVFPWDISWTPFVLFLLDTYLHQWNRPGCCSWCWTVPSNLSRGSIHPRTVFLVDHDQISTIHLPIWTLLRCLPVLGLLDVLGLGPWPNILYRYVLEGSSPHKCSQEVWWDALNMMIATTHSVMSGLTPSLKFFFYSITSSNNVPLTWPYCPSMWPPQCNNGLLGHGYDTWYKYLI